jgi:hypothetical protein
MGYLFCGWERDEERAPNHRELESIYWDPGYTDLSRGI